MIENFEPEKLAKAKLMANYETSSIMAAQDTVEKLIASGETEKAKEFAIKAIDDWRQEGKLRGGEIQKTKEQIITDFKNWLATESIVIEN